jgi:hypothetical protein
MIDILKILIIYYHQLFYNILSIIIYNIIVIINIFWKFIEQIRDLILNVSTNKSLFLISCSTSFNSNLSNECLFQYVPINIFGYFDNLCGFIYCSLPFF